jgi:hypothetical protein
MMTSGRMKLAMVVIVVASLSAGCATGTGKAGTAGAVKGEATQEPSSAMPARQLSVPSKPCTLLTPGMAQALYPSVVPSREAPPDLPGEAGCTYLTYVAQVPGAHVERVEYTVTTQEFGLQQLGSNFKLPRELAQSIASNPTSSGDTDAHFIELDGPGEQAVFLYGNRSGGGSEQSITWMHGNLIVWLHAWSEGTTGYTASLQGILLADARTIDTGLG